MKVDVLRASEHRGRIVVPVEDGETAVEVELSRVIGGELILHIVQLDRTTCEPQSTIDVVARMISRAYRLQPAAEDSAKVQRIVNQATDAPPESSAGLTAGGDRARLRGMPAIGRGVSGAIRGTSPGAELMRGS